MNEINDTCDECDFIYVTREQLYTHGYSHIPIPGLLEFVQRVKQHILRPWDLNQYELQAGHQLMHCRSFNIPLQPGVAITPELIRKELLDIRRHLGVSFRCRAGVSRIIQHSTPGSARPKLKLFRATHDGVAEVGMNQAAGDVESEPEDGDEGGAPAPNPRPKYVKVNADMVDGDMVNPLHPYTVTDKTSINAAASAIVEDITTTMLNERPGSSWKLVAPTNIRFYCYLLDFAGGHHYRGATLPPCLKRNGLLDPVAGAAGDTSGNNQCALYAIAQHFAEQRKK